jgi:hypothetical protein
MRSAAFEAFLLELERIETQLILESVCISNSICTFYRHFAIIQPFFQPALFQDALFPPRLARRAKRVTHDNQDPISAYSTRTVRVE